MPPRVFGQESLPPGGGEGVPFFPVLQQSRDRRGDLGLAPVAGDLRPLPVAVEEFRLHVGEERLAAGGGLEDAERDAARDRLGIGGLEVDAAQGIERRKVAEAEAARVAKAEGMGSRPDHCVQFIGPGLGLFQVAGEDGDGGGVEGGAEHPAADLVLAEMPREGAEGKEGVGRLSLQRGDFRVEPLGKGGEGRFDEGEGIGSEATSDEGALDLAGGLHQDGGKSRLARLDGGAGSESPDEDDVIGRFGPGRRRDRAEKGRIGGEMDGTGDDAVTFLQPVAPMTVPDVVADVGPPHRVEEAGLPLPPGDGAVGIVEPETDHRQIGDLGPFEESGESEKKGAGPEEGGGLFLSDRLGDGGGGLLRRGVGTAEGMFFHLVTLAAQRAVPLVEGEVAEADEGVEGEVEAHALAKRLPAAIDAFSMPDEFKKKAAKKASEKAPSFLVVDVSNSFTKFALATPERLLPGKGGTAPTPSLTLAAVRALAVRFRRETVFLSSVVPARTKIFERVFGKRLHVLHGNAALGMPVRYPNKARIGADRLANALAVRHLYGAPAVVIDFGTAVTFDVIDRSGAYCGGVIAPGLNMMTDYLHERTALLPRVEVREPRRAIGKSTEEAIRVGAVIGYRGMIREILGAVRKELQGGKKGPLHVVATGGQAGIVARKMPEVAAVVPGLTLDGLRIWAGTVLAAR